MEKSIPLTAAELGQIWGSYMDASLNKAVFSYFIEKAEDEEIKSVIQQALDLSQNHAESLKKFFEMENHPLPTGFTEEDVNTEAPRLYTDQYMLQHSLQLGALGMTEATAALSMTAHKDIYDYFKQAHQYYNSLHEHAMAIAIQKGIFLRQPIIPVPKKVDFVKKQNFIHGWFGDRRPLLAPEIANLYSNLQRNALGADTLTGFSQAAKSEKVKSFIQRGIEIAKKHTNIFTDILKESNVPVPMGSDASVTDSSAVSPFSDKLMIYHTTGMITLGIAFYGTSIPVNIRKDIATHLIRLSGEVILYAEDGANLMIENGWMEEPPRMVDRDELAKKKSGRSKADDNEY
ncbi:DUF3231 family protein [Virgibacillus kimchii]